jgi:D-alanine transaminase
VEIAIIDEKFLPLEELDKVYMDRGTFFGDGVYEVVRSYNGKIFALAEHIQRFENGLNAIGIENVDIEKIKQKVISAFEKSKIPNAKIYFHLTRGSGPREHNFTGDYKPNFFLTVTELPDCTSLKKNGVSVITHPDWRWKRCDIKSLNLLPNVLAKQAASEKNAFEAILVNEDGYITEGASSAFFSIFDEKVYTTPLQENILPSITRKFVTKACRNLTLEVIEKHLSPDEVKKADELFMAVTTKDILPIIEFNNVEISNRLPGEITSKIENEFAEFTG